MSLLSGLNHLLSADTPNKVEKCMNIVFSSRQDSVELGIQTIKKLLELESYEFAESCYKSLQICIETVLFSGLLEDLVSLYESEGKCMLSLISPNEWNGQPPFGHCLAKVVQLGDLTWEISERMTSP